MRPLSGSSGCPAFSNLMSMIVGNDLDETR